MVRQWLVGMGCGLGALLGVACSPSTVASTTGAPQSPREAGCDFQVLTVLPEGYAEIGVIDFKPSIWTNSSEWNYTELADVKKAIGADVCRAGGDAALAMANGTGQYAKVTILKRQSAAPRAQPVVVTSAQPSSPPANVAPTTDLGCHYDTQCKGDRVCNAGQCVEPAPALTPPPGTTAKSPPSVSPAVAP